jgi:hypothetical protein
MSTIKVDTVTTLDGTGNITLSRPLTGLSGSGASLTALNATELTSGTLPMARLSGTLPALNGSALTALNATNLASGTVPTARLGSGTANNGVFLRGDGTWNAAGGGVDGISSSADATAITITSAEKVGIGITNPNSTFVVSDGGAYGMEFYPNDNNVSKILAYDRSGSAYRDFKISGNQVIFGYGTSGNNEGMRINNVGAITMPKQPCFQAQITGPGENNVTGNSATYTVGFATENFDLAGNFASGTFTAPVTGKYLLSVHITVAGVTGASDGYDIQILTSNRQYQTSEHLWGDGHYSQRYNSLVVIADMDASDTAYVRIIGTGESGNVWDIGGVTPKFYGCLLA